MRDLSALIEAAFASEEGKMFWFLDLQFDTTLRYTNCDIDLWIRNTKDYLDNHPNLVGLWRFDDGSGRVAIDGSGNENHGELVGFPTSDTYELNEFQNSSDGFTANNATITEKANSITLEAIASNPQLRKAGMSIVGGDHYIVSVRIKRIAGSTWRGKLYYSTGGHGNSESYKKHFSQPSNFSVYQTIVLDMRDLTAGGSDWIDNTITALRFDFGAGAGDDFEIDWIKIGQNIWVDGHVGKCVNIAGAEYAQAVVQVAAPLTLTFWFKPSSDTTQVSGGLFLLWQDATHEIAFKLYNPGTPNPLIDPTGYVTQHTHGEYTFLANQWYMGVFKLATGSMQLDIWKDGEIVNTRSHSDAGYASYNFTYLFWGSFGSDCCHDETRLYDSILTDSEIKALNDNPGQFTINKFETMPFQIGTISYSAKSSVDKINIEIGNVDLQMSAVFLNEDIMNKWGILRIGFLDSDNTIIDQPFEVFRGLVSTWKLSEPKASITLVNEFILWNKKTLRKHQSACRWPFKGTECKYAGAETWCDQSHARCLALSNQDNFGGDRWLPDLMEKEIYWGKTT